MEHDRNVLFRGAIPENYDRFLGPVMFEPWAEDLVLRLAGRKYDRVLEIACGTGIVSRRLRYALPAMTEIIATDLNRTCSNSQSENLERMKTLPGNRPMRPLFRFQIVRSTLPFASSA